jgi:hypothetical protein
VTTSTTAVDASTTSASSGAADPNAKEVTPPGDIPDNQVFVSYAFAPGHMTLDVPEGWSRTTGTTWVVFTDKLNSVRVDVAQQASPPTVASVKRDEVPALARSSRKFQLVSVATVTRHAGTAVLVRYRSDAPPDPVTGKVVHDDVERYDFWHAGALAPVTLSGPQGADNVDPWRTVTDSVRWTP